MIKLTEEEKELYIETAKTLKGSERRLFMARIEETDEIFNSLKKYRQNAEEDSILQNLS